MRELFIYWRTETATAAAAEEAALAWQAELRLAHPGLQAALYRRSDEAGTTATLMEVYAGAAIDTALEKHLADEGARRFARWLQGPRHVEVFVRRSPD